ncbi:glycosyltransferase [Saprospiraceae bacterium]|nr:glycosyltransferase [Saprospiraceae bacterium]MDG1435596.1 glycosyltransferase [Saprospiraceae bacterium]
MSKFNVLSLGEFIHKEGIDVTLEAFADLYYDVTSKHQKQMKLIMVSKGSLQDYIHEKADKLGLSKVIEIIFWSEQEEIEEWYKNASIMLLPSKGKITRLIKEAFSFGLPVVCYESDELDEIMDPSCGMTIENDNLQESIIEFSDVLRMLYFDPEARKILKRGALKKYETQFTWGYTDAA